MKLARRIAGAVRRWHAARVDRGRPQGDVLVLLRRRGALFEAIIRALKKINIPVAGADRLVLTEHIAVMDLMVLADAILLPQDDLALATALKSRCSALTMTLFLSSPGIAARPARCAANAGERQPCGAVRLNACGQRATGHRLHFTPGCWVRKKAGDNSGAAGRRKPTTRSTNFSHGA